jgi:catechol 2,3-dioxygenase-like lactoylglutathione lyase family enzyme
MATKIDMIGIFVTDLPRMVAFYRDALGFEIDWDGQGPYAEFKHEGVRFSMYERAQLPGLLGQPPSFPSGLNGTFELAIDLPTSAGADAMFARVVAAGGRPVYAPRDEPWGMHSSMIADPDGNLIEIGSWNRGAGSQD